MLIMNDIIFFITSIRDVGNSDYNFFEKHNHFLMTDVLERTSKRRLTRWTSSDKASLFTIHFIGSIDRSHLYLEKSAQFFISCSTRIYVKHDACLTSCAFSSTFSSTKIRVSKIAVSEVLL